MRPGAGVPVSGGLSRRERLCGSAALSRSGCRLKPAFQAASATARAYRMLRQQLRISTASLSDVAEVSAPRARPESLSKVASATFDKDESGRRAALCAPASVAGLVAVAGFEGGGTGGAGPVTVLSGSAKRAARRVGSSARDRRARRACRGRDCGVFGTQVGQGATAGAPSGRGELTQQVSPQSGQSLGRVGISRSEGSVSGRRPSRRARDCGAY